MSRLEGPPTAPQPWPAARPASSPAAGARTAFAGVFDALAAGGQPTGKAQGAGAVGVQAAKQAGVEKANHAGTDVSSTGADAPARPTADQPEAPSQGGAPGDLALLLASTLAPQTGSRSTDGPLAAGSGSGSNEQAGERVPKAPPGTLAGSRGRGGDAPAGPLALQAGLPAGTPGLGAAGSQAKSGQGVAAKSANPSRIAAAGTPGFDPLQPKEDPAAARVATAPTPAHGELDAASPALATVPAASTDPADTIPGTPGQQVLAALRTLGLEASADEGHAPDNLAPTAADPGPGDLPTAPAPPLRALSVQLHPDHLGAVVLTVQRQDGRLAVTVAVRDARALRLLERDRGLLDQVVAGAGGSRESLTLSLSPAPTGDAAPSPSAQTRSQHGALADPSQGEARHPRQVSPASPPTGPLDDPSSIEPDSSVRLDRGLYL